MKFPKVLNKSALTAFVASAVATVSLGACEEVKMYCLTASGPFYAVFEHTSGDEDCLPEHGELYFDYFLGKKDDGNADPGESSLAVTVPAARTAINAAETHLWALQTYSDCPSANPDVETEPDDSFLEAEFYAYGPFSDAFPDGEEKCFGEEFSSASITTPDMDAIPVCPEVEDDEATDAYVGTTIEYSVNDVEIRVSPAVQGLRATGTIEYTQDSCSGTYSFKAINPVIHCESDEECTDAEKYSSQAGAINDQLRAEGLKCYIADGEEIGFCGLE